MPCAMAEFDRRAASPARPSHRSTSRPHPRRSSRHGHREQAPAAEPRGRASRARRGLRRGGMLQGREHRRRGARKSAREDFRLRQFFPVRRHRGDLAPQPRRATRPARSMFHTWTSRDFLRARHGVPRASAHTSFDGGHSFADQFEGLQYALPSFADDALVIIDDTNKREARAADALVRAHGARLRAGARSAHPRNHHPTWWNGVQVFRFRRAASTPVALPDPRRAVLGAPPALRFDRAQLQASPPRVQSPRQGDAARAAPARPHSERASARLQHRFVGASGCAIPSLSSTVRCAMRTPRSAELRHDIDEVCHIGVIGDSEHDAGIVLARAEVQIDDRPDQIAIERRRKAPRVRTQDVARAPRRAPRPRRASRRPAESRW